MQDFCISARVEDLRTASQNVYNACLTYVCKSLMIPNSALYFDRKTYRYNIPNVFLICQTYCYLCNTYEKEISIIGFSNLTSINRDTIFEWNNNPSNYIYIDLFGNEITISNSDIYKMLNQGREESLSNMLISGKRNPVGILGALNHRFGWNTQNQVLEVRQTALVERSALGISAKPTENDDIKPPTTDQ